jgi:hypothetical protein
MMMGGGEREMMGREMREMRERPEAERQRTRSSARVARVRLTQLILTTADAGSTKGNSRASGAQRGGEEVVV